MKPTNRTESQQYCYTSFLSIAAISSRQCITVCPLSVILTPMSSSSLPSHSQLVPVLSMSLSLQLMLQLSDFAFFYVTVCHIVVCVVMWYEFELMVRFDSVREMLPTRQHSAQ